MQSTRIAVVWSLGLVLLACSSTTVGTGRGDTGGDDDTADAGGGTADDAGADASTQSDSGDDDDDDAGDAGLAVDAAPGADAAVCAVGTPPAESYPFHPAVPPSNSCSDAEVQGYVMACGHDTTAATCEPFKAAHPTCTACLETKQTDASWGVVVTDTISDIQNPNFGGCVALIDTSSTGLACAKNGEALALCEAAACDPTCADAATSEQLECEQQAGATSGPCQQYGAAADACVNDLKNGAYDTCGLQDNYNDAVVAIAAVLCQQ
jgi:hypothetical protein